MPALEVVSIIGSVFFILGFGALNLGWVNSESYSYQFANILGALCFTYTAISPFNAGLFITEAVWALIGIYGAWKIMRIARDRKAMKEATAQ
ncbi:transporter [Arcanobacterium buesumense]|uniref:Transporter n=2 Tax=Arcanobacterium buesumense TaxID=2722751 RepID=A0A6H2ENU3_9ACTO|nr:transporter [Arcanobacterium buesumense]